jgi:DNA-binding NarL/FixJ family response regulator
MTDTTAPVSVLLVDDHAVVREGYRRLLERAGDIAVCGEAASAAEAYQAFIRHAPDVTVMDISLPDVSGIEAMRRLLSRDPGARVLMFSIHEEPIFPDRAIKAGARGYITKSSAPEILVEAVRTVARGDVYFSADVAAKLEARDAQESAERMNSLSTREFEIVRLLAAGHSVRDIAERLCLNGKTVANYQSSIRRKLGASTPVQLLRIAAESGLAGDAVNVGAGRETTVTG